MSSLLAALQNRTPLVWVKSVEPERLIAQLPSLIDHRNLFVHDPMDGLMQWSHAEKEFKIVLITVETEEDGEVEIPIFSFENAFGHVMKQDRSVFVIRNIHKDIENYLNYFSAVFLRFRDAFYADDLDTLPVQIVCLAGETDCPVEIAGMSSACEHGTPSEGEIRHLIEHIREVRGDSITGEQDIEELVAISGGITELQLMEFYLKSIRTHGVISGNEIKEMKLERLRASSMLDIRHPKFSLDNIGGLDKAKELILKADWIRNNPDKAAEFKLTPLRRFLFLGPPGVGKSMICEGASTTLGLDLAIVGVGKAMNKFIGESERLMRETFRQIRALAPITMWIDELGRDLSGGGSSDVVDGGTTSRVHAEFLTGVQELPDNVFLFAAANSISALAPEMLRAGRFDTLLFCGFPAQEERIKILQLDLQDDGVEHDYDLLARKVFRFTGAEIRQLVMQARMDVVTPTSARKINTQDIIATIPKMRNRIWLRYHGEWAYAYQQAMTEYEWASDAQRDEAQMVLSGREYGSSTSTRTMQLK